MKVTGSFYESEEKTGDHDLLVVILLAYKIAS